MKKISNLMAWTSLLMIVLCLFSFNRPGKVFVNAVYWYIDGAAYQRIEDGVNVGPAEGRSINSDPNFSNPHFKRLSNWSSSPNSATLYDMMVNDGSSYVNSLEISSWESTSDGDNDGAISLEEALTATYAYFKSTGVYPSSFLADADANGIGVTVYTTKAEDSH